MNASTILAGRRVIAVARGTVRGVGGQPRGSRAMSVKVSPGGGTLGRKAPPMTPLPHFCLRTECMRAQLLQLCPTLCDLMDCSPPGFSVHGISLASILEWVAMPSSKESSQPRDRTHVSYVSIGRWILLVPPGKPAKD